MEYATFNGNHNDLDKFKNIFQKGGFGMMRNNVDSQAHCLKRANLHVQLIYGSFIGKYVVRLRVVARSWSLYFPPLSPNT